MRKILSLVSVVCILFLFTACASRPTETESGEDLEESSVFTDQERDNQPEEFKESAVIPTNEPAGTDAAEIGKFDLETGTVLLNSGYEMPILGIGIYALSMSQAENFVYWALRDGYRLIDTARIYGNEEGVGRGIPREKAFGIMKKGGNILKDMIK